MKPRFKKAKILVCALLIVVLLAIIWLYSGGVTQAKIKIFKLLPLPVALVNNQPIFIDQFLNRQNIAQKLSGQPEDLTNNSQSNQEIFQEIIKETLIGQLALKYGVSVSQNQIDQDYQSQAAQADLQGHQTFDQLLQSYGLSANIYKYQVIKPQLLETNLQIWYDSQQNLNQGLYSQAENLVSQINATGTMEKLAVSFTQDNAGRAVSGDLGFVDVSQILPELREAVEAMKVGDVKIISSRLGLHIIRLEGKNGNLLHLRQIFLQNSSFNDWYQLQIKNFKVISLINF
jgi:parvulin-like peptidyl-prolyl isomerase